MCKHYHTYTPNEISNSTGLRVPCNWDPSNYLTHVDINDSNVGVRQVSIIAFNSKLDALNYFHSFISNLNEDSSQKYYTLKLSGIDNSINSIKASRNDKDIDLGIVDFQFDDLSLSTYNSGYWIDSTKLILKQIIDEIDIYFEMQYDDDTIESDYLDLNSSRFSTSSLRKLQAECQNLINFENIHDTYFIETFNHICIYMNDFWDFWFE